MSDTNKSIATRHALFSSLPRSAPRIQRAHETFLEIVVAAFSVVVVVGGGSDAGSAVLL